MTSAYQARIDAQQDDRGPGYRDRIRELAEVSARIQQRRHEERSDEEEGPEAA